MRFSEFSLEVVRSAVDSQERKFHTGNMWNDRLMRERHFDAPENTYRGMVGRFLSMRRTELSVELRPNSTLHRGQLWRRFEPRA